MKHVVEQDFSGHPQAAVVLRVRHRPLFFLSPQEKKEIKESQAFLGNGAKRGPKVTEELQAPKAAKDRWVPRGILASTSMLPSQWAEKKPCTATRAISP